MIFCRQREELSKGPNPIENYQNPALRTVGPSASASKGAGAARTVDLSNNSPTHPIWIVALLHRPHKLVTENTSKIHVAVLDLKISGANPSQRDTDQGFRGPPLRGNPDSNNEPS